MVALADPLAAERAKETPTVTASPPQ